MRAVFPDRDGYVDRDGVKVFYEVFGDDHAPTIVLNHGWALCDSRLWKMQTAVLADRYRLIAWDWPGNGKSDRPVTPEAHMLPTIAGHIPAICEATGTERAILMAHSAGTMLSVLVASLYPDLVEAMVLIGGLALGEDTPLWPMAESITRFNDRRLGDDWYDLLNQHAWDQGRFPEFLDAFMHSMFPERHSTKEFEDSMLYTHGTSAEIQTACFLANGAGLGPAMMEAVGAMLRGTCEQVGCPVLVVHGSEDVQAPLSVGEELARQVGGELVVFDGSGHAPHARDPIRFNRLVREFVDQVHPPAPRARRWTRALSRGPRALMVCSPIGLGHALRDVAVARELRALRPDLEIEWLAQHPVTAVLADAGETVHPASRALASESAHIESEAGEHDLHAFQAIRTMDEILVHNFSVFDDLMRDEPFDVVVADEGWDLDHFLHENPECKRSPLVWMTDFVGWVPMPDGGEHERSLTTDYNAEMVEHIARFPWVRDRSIFVGDPDDIPPVGLGDGLPSIRAWTEEHFAFAGYITGFDAVADRDEVRAQLGWQPGENVCVVTVGGSGVGDHLLRKVIASYPAAARAIDGLRMVVVSGPRIDPASLAAPAGVDVHGYVPGLHRLLAACDVAVVQGGLTTTMELTAARRPFLSFPLANHFEQQVHVRHRLERHGAGTTMDYATSTPDTIAAALATEIARDTGAYLPVATDGARRAAALIAEVV